MDQPLSTRQTRPFCAEDIPDVCDLFSRTFRPGVTVRSDDLADAFRETYLTAPAYRPERGSIVHVDQTGRIDGFMGIINITLRLGNRTLQAGIMSAYMADKSANSGVGLTLVRAARRLPLDLIFSDTASRRSLEISRPLDFILLPLQSLQWMKVLAPSGMGAYLLSRKQRALGRWLGRPAGLLDTLLSRHAFCKINEHFHRGTRSQAITMERFVASAAEFLDDSVLRPVWDPAELSWIVTQASRQLKHGALHFREVTDRNGRVAGLYLFHARAGGVAVTLHLLARPGREEMVVGDMLHQAKQLGAVVVKGAGSRALIEGMVRQRGVIYRHVMACVVWTADAEIAAALRRGDAQLGGLAGETWARVFSDAFG